MRAPRIRVSNQQRQKPKTQNTDCLLCLGKICQKGQDHYSQAKMITRSVTKWQKGFEEIIIYETYRCMPLLGDEKIQAPDWEEHIVKYHIVFVKEAI